MIRNGRTIPFPSEFATPPASSSQTGRGNCGFNPRMYAVTAFTRAKERNPESDRCLEALIDSSIRIEMPDGIRGRSFVCRNFWKVSSANHYRGVKNAEVRSARTADDHRGFGLGRA